MPARPVRLSTVIRFNGRGRCPVKVFIDGRSVLDERDLQKRLAGAFGYGPVYARDLSALRERLAAGDPRPLELAWIHADAIRLALGNATFRAYVEVFEAIEAADEGRPWDERLIFRLFD
jgi:RNAse (barnase) inhibitor barstar